MIIQQKGAVTLFITIILLVVLTLIILFAAQFSIMQQKIGTNQYRNMQALNAAEAGLEFAIVYLNNNSNIITANPVNGYINYGPSDSNITNITFTNNAKFSIVYTNPTANNYLLIEVTSTGTSDDGASVRTVKQKIYGGISSLNAAITTKGNLVSSGNVTVTGSSGIHAGGTVTQSGVNSISSIIQNDAVLRNLSSDALFSTVFGATKAEIQAQSTYFSNTSGLDYNTLTGKNWINSSVIVSGEYTIGSPANPVLLVVNGSFIASGRITIYGLMYVTGTVTVSGAHNFNGGLVSEGAVTMSGVMSAYNSALVNAFTAHTYAKIPGSWKDF
jgi:Tfp pilus assembly protein PilX